MENQSPVPPKQNNEVTPITTSFYEALPLILEKKRITRLAWNSKDEYVFLGENGNIWIHTKEEDHQWGPIHETDIVAEDWFEVKLQN